MFIYVALTMVYSTNAFNQQYMTYFHTTQWPWGLLEWISCLRILKHS